MHIHVLYEHAYDGQFYSDLGDTERDRLFNIVQVQVYVTIWKFPCYIIHVHVHVT